MPAQLSFDAERTAVLSMDLQVGIVSIYVKDQELLARAATVLRRARASGMRIIHVQVGFRPNLPEVSTRNPLLAAIKSSPEHQRLFQVPQPPFIPRSPWKRTTLSLPSTASAPLQAPTSK